MKQYRFAKAVRRANAAVIPLQAMHRRRTVQRAAGFEEGRSTVGSSGDASSAEAGTGFLGGLMAFQAVVRRVRAAEATRLEWVRVRRERAWRERSNFPQERVRLERSIFAAPWAAWAAVAPLDR